MRRWSDMPLKSQQKYNHYCMRGLPRLTPITLYLNPLSHNSINYNHKSKCFLTLNNTAVASHFKSNTPISGQTQSGGEAGFTCVTILFPVFQRWRWWWSSHSFCLQSSNIDFCLLDAWIQKPCRWSCSTFF